MPLNLGDAFLTFRGDLTELNLAFDQAAQSAEKLAPAQAKVDALGAGFDRVATDAEVAAAAMKSAGEAGSQAGAQIQSAWQAVAKATVENYQAQQELRAAMYAVKSTGGDSAEAMERLATAQERATVTANELTRARELATASAHEATKAEEELSFSMREATGTMALAGEEMGVKIPRHLRSFIAELPGVGAAMEAAFSGVALIVLAQLIVEATNKLTEFISETFIYTEADKKAYEAQVELNKAIAEQAQKIKELKEAYDLLGLSGSKKTSAEFMKLTEEVRNQESALRDAQNTLYEYRNGLNDVTEEQAKAAQDVVARLSGASGLLTQLYLQQATLSKQYDQELLSEQIAHDEKSVQADKTVGEARIALLQAQSRLRLAVVQNSYFQQGQAQAQFEEQRYQLDLSTLERLRAVAARDPNNPDKVRELNAQIEALTQQHQAKLINDSVDFYEKIKALQKQAQPEDAKVPDTAIQLSDAGKAILQLQEGLKALGIQGSATWTEQKLDAVAAYDKIKATGLATYTDLRQALLKVRQAQLGEALAIGDQTAADKYKKEIKDITAELTKLGIITDQTANKSKKFGAGFKAVSQMLDEYGRKLQADRGELTQTQAAFESVISSTTSAFGNAVSQWAAGQESMGRALQQGLATEAATIAGKAAMWGAYFTAWGIADSFWNPARAGADFASAAEFFALAGIAGAFAFAIRPGSDNTTAASPNSGVSVAPADATPATNPTPVTNVQRFATGGLVSSPTLAVIGDSITSASRAASEAILPLEDPRAMSRIAGAITSQMPQSNSGGHIHITLESDVVQTIRKINHAVKNNGVPLTASTALKVTKKA